MLKSLTERRNRDEEGFTLIELMVVVLIIAILLAIAIPTFLGARERANDRAAQSSLRNALTAAKVLYTDSQDFAAADSASEMLAVEPSLTYITTDSTTFKEVSLAVTPTSGVATEWAGAALSKTGTCWYIHETASSGTKFGKLESGSASCAGTDALAANGASF